MKNNIKPEWRLEANSQDITSAIRERLISLSLTDQAGLESDKLRIELADHDPEKRIAIPAHGAELDLYIGYDGAAAHMGMFIVDGITLSGPPDKIIIKAKASPQAKSESGAGSNRLMLTTQKTRSWEAEMTLGAIVQTIAGEHGLEPAITGELSGIVLPHIDQVNESDMALLTRLAHNYDAIAKPAAGRLIMTKRATSKAVSGAAMPSIPLTPSDVSTWSVELEERTKPGTVIALYRDLEEGKDIEVTAGSKEPVRRLRHTYSSQSEATSAAKSALEQGRRNSGRLTLKMPGRTTIAAETTITLTGFRDGVDGQWVTTTATHSLSDKGYSLSVSAEAG